jgi:hypothetical protein
MRFAGSRSRSTKVGSTCATVRSGCRSMRQEDHESSAECRCGSGDGNLRSASTSLPRLPHVSARQLEMQLPGDRRKEFVISVDTARSADPTMARNFEIVVARCGQAGAAIWVAAISSPATPISPRSGIAACKPSERRDTAVLGTR